MTRTRTHKTKTTDNKEEQEKEEQEKEDVDVKEKDEDGNSKICKKDDWHDVLPLSSFSSTSTTILQINSDSHPTWTNTPVAFFSFPTLNQVDGYSFTFHAISNACPHVAIGSLSEGDACVFHPRSAAQSDLVDVEDLLLHVVSCPVHTYVFDLTTGHCLTNQTSSANVYNVRVNQMEMVQIYSKPNKAKKNHVSIEVGQQAQLKLVEIGLNKKYGPLKLLK